METYSLQAYCLSPSQTGLQIHVVSLKNERNVLGDNNDNDLRSDKTETSQSETRVLSWPLPMQRVQRSMVSGSRALRFKG